VRSLPLNSAIGCPHFGSAVRVRYGALMPVKLCVLPSLVVIFPRILSPESAPSNTRSRSDDSHCGGIAKPNLPLSKFTSEIGRALPPVPTKRPTNVFNPESSTSSQEGRDSPFTSMVMFQRPTRLPPSTVVV